MNLSIQVLKFIIFVHIMMLLSQTCQVAIKSIAHIAATEKFSVKVEELAFVTSENKHTIAKVLQRLAKGGFLSSVTGPHGGFFLTEGQLNNRLSDIIKAVDGERIFNGCVLGLNECSQEHPCPVHNQIADIRKKTIKIFEKTKLSELASVILNGNVFLK